MDINNNNTTNRNSNRRIYTVPNQKNIIIHKEKANDNFMTIKNKNWMEANKELSPYGLQLYLYLAKNKDGFNLALSQKAAEEAGIRKTSFHTYLKRLIDNGYLVKRSGNTYDFYETPYGKPLQEENENE